MTNKKKYNFELYISILIILIFLFVGVFFNILPIVPPNQSSNDILVAPSFQHLFGTDDLGMDVFSQILYGTRTSILLGFSCAFLSTVGGSIIGVLAGYYGGLVDKLFLSLVDIIIALPELPFMIVLSAFLGTHIVNIVIAISLISWIMPAKLVRSKVIKIKHENYVIVSKQYGASFFYILQQHFLPSVFPILAVSFIRIVNKSILAEASLAFLGLSDPISKSWGMVLNRGLGFDNIFLTNYWKWWVVFPTITLIIFALSISNIARHIEREFL